MVTSTDIYDRGKLGNQLFVCALLLAIRYELGYEIRIPDYKGKWFAGQENLLSNFRLSDSIPFLTENEISKIQYPLRFLHMYKINHHSQMVDIIVLLSLHQISQKKKYH